MSLREFFVVACVALGQLGSQGQAAPEKTIANSVTYLALGDSFTIGTGEREALNFPSQLAAMLRRRGASVRVVNAAVNGFSTAELMRDELPALESVRPNLVTLAVGANDLVRDRDPETYRARLKAIFERLAASKARVVVLPQPDWASAPIAASFGDRANLRGQIERYNAVLREEATGAHATFVDCWPLMRTQAEQRLFADDGLHPSAKAYTAWAERVLAALDDAALTK